MVNYVLSGESLIETKFFHKFTYCFDEFVVPSENRQDIY